jgi:colanic acid biosynthesis glycosyl transferase WcaI
MSRIIFLNRFFYPDHSATSQILSDLAFHLGSAGQDVHVITSQQIYDDPSARLPSEEIVSGVQIHRVATTQFGRSHLVGRSLDYLSFYWSMWRRVVSFAERDDILVAKTDPPLLSVLAMYAARRCSTYFINWLQDLYPEIAVELDVPFIKGPIGSAIAALRNRSLRKADINIAPGRSMATRLHACGVAKDRIHVIPNWANDDEIIPVSAAENPLRREWGLDGKFVVGYSGNLGRAHEFDTLLNAAECLRDNLQFVFLFIGGGKQFDELANSVRTRNLERSFRFYPYQDRNVLKYSLSAPDLHWISLRTRLEGLVFPSKFYGIAAAGRPMIAIAAKNGDIAELITQYDCGIIVEPGDADNLARALTLLSRDPLRCAEMGRHARTMIDTDFSCRQAIARWQNVLASIAQPDSLSANLAKKCR